MQPGRMQIFWKNRSPITMSLIAVNAAIFLLQLLDSATTGGWVTRTFGLTRDGLESFQVWQVVTHLFLHDPQMWAHIVLNMLALWFAGREVEDILGPRRYLIVYFAGGIFGGLLQVYTSVQDVLLIGASGSIFAILLAFTTIHANTVITVLLFFIFPLRVKAKYIGIGLIAASVLFWVFAVDQRFGHAAHLGGALVGYLLSRYWGYGNPTWIERFLHRKNRELPGGWEMMYPGRGSDERFDAILDKISREGFESLTPEEKEILHRRNR